MTAMPHPARAIFRPPRWASTSAQRFGALRRSRDSAVPARHRIAPSRAPPGRNGGQRHPEWARGQGAGAALVLTRICAVPRYCLPPTSSPPARAAAALPRRRPSSESASVPVPIDMTGPGRNAIGASVIERDPQRPAPTARPRAPRAPWNPFPEMCTPRESGSACRDRRFPERFGSILLVAGFQTGGILR
jgi:hypothetical protein